MLVLAFEKNLGNSRVRAPNPDMSELRAHSFGFGVSDRSAHILESKYGPVGACLAVRTPPSASRSRSVVVMDRTVAAVLGEQRVAAVAEQVEVERLVGLLLAVTLDFDGDGLPCLTRGEGQRAGMGDVVVVAGRGGAVHGAV